MEGTIIREAGLTEGEAKVYLALLKLGPSTTGPIIEKSGVANSIVYRILTSLIEKGLVSYIIKDKTKHFESARPERLIEYIEERKELLEESKQRLAKMLPALKGALRERGKPEVRVYEGFKGIQTAFEQYHLKLSRGEEYIALGGEPVQEPRFDLYWQRDHLKRAAAGIKCRLFFCQGTGDNTMKNRNAFKGCDARIIPTPLRTPAWFMVYKDTTEIVIQTGKPTAVEIINQEIADTFRGIFEDYWRISKPCK